MILNEKKKKIKDLEEKLKNNSSSHLHKEANMHPGHCSKQLESEKRAGMLDFGKKDEKKPYVASFLKKHKNPSDIRSVNLIVGGVKKAGVEGKREGELELEKKEGLVIPEIKFDDESLEYNDLVSYGSAVAEQEIIKEGDGDGGENNGSFEEDVELQRALRESKLEADRMLSRKNQLSQTQMQKDNQKEEENKSHDLHIKQEDLSSSYSQNKQMSLSDLFQ